MSNVIPQKRFRRTKEGVEKDFFDAAISIIEKVGFSGLTVTSLTKEADIDPPVFYYRYKDINGFIDKFVRNYDYWLNDAIVIDTENSSSTKNIEDIIVNLVDSLLDNVCMQKLIAWELTEDNLLTRRTSQNRDNNSELLLKYLENEFKNCNVNFNAAAAIVIGGVYYLIIHRKMSTFNKIDFSTKEGIELLKATIRLIIKSIFNDSDNRDTTKETKDMINRMIADGLDRDKICKYLNISSLEFNSLTKRSIR